MCYSIMKYKISSYWQFFDAGVNFYFEIKITVCSHTGLNTNFVWLFVTSERLMRMPTEALFV